MSKFLLVFLLLFVGGLIAAFVSSPVFAVMLYQLVYFMNPETRWWARPLPGLPYSFITVLVMLFILLIRYKSLTTLTSWRQQPAFKWMFGILALYYVVGLYAIVPAIHKTFVFDFTKLIIIIFVAYKMISTPKALHYVMWAYIIGASYIGYVAKLTGRDEYGRVEGIGMVDTGGDSNYTSAALAPAVVMLMYYVWTGNNKVRLLCAVCGALLVNGLVLINSRGAFIGVVAGAAFFLCYMLFSKYQRKGQRTAALAVIVVGLLGALSMTDRFFWERMSTMKNIEDGNASGSHRVEFWLASFNVMRDHPGGVGVSGFEALSRAYLPESAFFDHDVKAVHSSWFQLMLEGGYPAPIFFALMLVGLYRLLGKTKKYLLESNLTNEYFHVLVLEASCLSYMVAATFINRIRAESLWWSILFLMVATNVYYLQKLRQQQLSATRGSQGRSS